MVLLTEYIQLYTSKYFTIILYNYIPLPSEWPSIIVMIFLALEARILSLLLARPLLLHNLWRFPSRNLTNLVLTRTKFGINSLYLFSWIIYKDLTTNRFIEGTRGITIVYYVSLLYFIFLIFRVFITLFTLFQFIIFNILFPNLITLFLNYFTDFTLFNNSYSPLNSYNFKAKHKIVGFIILFILLFICFYFFYCFID